MINSLKAHSLLTLLTLLTTMVQSHAQVQVDTTHTADYLVNEILLGQGVLAGNVQVKGEKHAIALYRDQSSQVGISEGIVLTSGNAYYAIGPNKTPRAGWASGAPGDEDLQKIARGRTYDAAILEFDFVTSSENLAFNFVFASEEYLEYVGSKFNDVFAFLVDGPGLHQVNIARLPDRKTPITVNTVNNKLNAKYYVDNTYENVTDPYVWDVKHRKVVKNKNYLEEEVPPRYNIQYDGFTKVLTASAKVIPNEKYHIKIAIADVGDGILDSGVFLKGGSFRSYGDEITKIDEKWVDELLQQEPEVEVQVTEAPVEPVPMPQFPKILKVEFAFDKYFLPDSAYAIIEQVYQYLVAVPHAKVQIIGHTDNFGSNDYNYDLSRKRSDAVATALQNLGLKHEKVIKQSYGEDQPIDSNQNPEGRARNRRVEFVITFNTNSDAN